MLDSKLSVRKRSRTVRFLSLGFCWDGAMTNGLFVNDRFSYILTEKFKT
jgi:hypothetical protein